MRLRAGKLHGAPAIVKPRESWVDDPVMRAKVVKEADAAVFAVGL